MQLSKHFHLEEFTHSQVAARMGRDLVVPAHLMANLTQLCDLVLEPIRQEVGSPVKISSGYRDTVTNTLVGGAKDSAHTQARAADIYVPGMPAARLARIIQHLALPGLDKCILEFDSWVHVQVAAPGSIARQQYLTASRVNTRTVYATGIVSAA